MKKITKGLSLTLTCLILLSFSGLQDWVSFTSKEGKYKMLFPSDPKEQTQTVQTGVGDIIMYLAMVESEDENASNLLYMSAYCVYPAELVSSEASKETLEKFFKGAAEGAAKKMNGDVRTLTDATHKGFPAKDVLIDANLGGADFVVRQKLILVKNNFYMIQTFARKEMETNSESKKFVESFSLIE